MAKQVRKLSRKELLKEDEFLVKSKTYVTVLMENMRLISAIGIALLVVAAVGVGVNYFVKNQSMKSVGLFGDAMIDYKAPVVTQEQIDQNPRLKTMKTYPDEKTKFENAAKKFDAVFNESEKTASGKLALFYAANAYYQLEDYDNAAQRYKQYLEKIGTDRIHGFYELAVEGLGYSLEGQGNLDEAIASFEKLITPENKSFRERGLTQAARLYLEKENKERALELYKTLVTDFPDSPSAAVAKRKIAQLESAA